MPLQSIRAVSLLFLACTSVCATTVTLTSSSNPANFGQPVTLTATVTAGATGKVTFYDGVLPLGIGILSNNVATLTSTTLPVGTRSLRAYYAGDAANAPATSPSISQAIVAGVSRGLRAPVNSAAGSNPYFVAVADLNGDNNQDLVVANSNIGNISVLLGNGDGTFRAAVNYTVGSNPLSVAIGDWNGDGNPDLAVANNNSTANTLSVLLGNGDGTFQTATTANAGTYPAALAVGDFNADGKPDLAIAANTSTNNSMRVMLGNGDGTFQTPVNYSGSNAPFASVGVGDLNGDGKADLVFSGYYGSITVLLGNGDGTFQTATSPFTNNNGLSSVLTLADFNGDGKLDVAIGLYYNNSIAVLLGNGDGTFQTAANYVTGQYPRFVASADLNGDGTPDLLNTSANGSYGTYFGVLTGGGNGTFPAAISYTTPSNSYGLAIGDFNRDGKADVVTANYSTSNISVFFGGAITDLSISVSHGGGFVQNQAGAFYKLTVSNTGDIASSGPVGVSDMLPNGFTATAINGARWACALGTLTCSRSDTLAPGASYPPITITVNVPSQPGSATNTATVSGGADNNTANNVTADVTNVRFTSSVSLTSSPNPSILGSAVTLTATVSAGSGKATFYDGANLIGIATVASGKAVFLTSQLSSGLHSLTVRFDGDSNFGPVLSAAVSQLVTALPTSGIQPIITSKAGAGSSSLAVADFNRDGKLDVVTGNTNDVSLLLGNGDGTFQAAVSLASTTSYYYYPMVPAAGDLNGDGKPDLAVAYSDGSLYLVLGNGDGTFQTPVKIVAAGSSSSSYNSPLIVITDTNRDGLPDIITANSNSLTVLLGNGDGTFQPALTNSGANLSRGYTSFTDLNNDGLLDIVYTGNNSDTGASVMLAVGDGTFSTPFFYPGPAFSYSQTMVTGDFNSDGRSDVVLLSGSGYSRLNGNGDGTLQAASAFKSLNAYPGYRAIAGDLNGDGRQDILYTGSPGGIAAIFGDGIGNFPTGIQLQGDGSTAMVLADINGDGRPDIVSVDSSNSRVTVYLGAQVSGLGLNMSHRGNFTAGGTGSYQITVSNNTLTAPSGITVNINLPAGLTYTSYSGDGWSCSTAPIVCSPYFYSALPTGATSTTLNLVVSVSSNLSPVTLTNQATTTYNGVVTNVSDPTFIVTPTTTTVSASPNPAALSQAVTLTATPTGTGAALTGTVSFFANGIILGSSSLSNGTATLTTRALPTGLNAITATYLGDSTHGGSQSAVRAVTVNAGQTSGFTSPSTYATGVSPGSVVAADLNGDGNMDLITPNRQDNTVSVLLGNGDGTFRAKVDSAVGKYPISVVAGDLNGDGKPDLVVANNSDKSLGILLGNGDGTFRSATTLPLSQAPQSLAIGDFNQDAKLDILVVVGDPSVVLLLGNGDGTFAQSSMYLGSGSVGLSVADLNRDGLPDVVAGGYSYLGNGDGTFRSGNYAYPNTNSIAVGDIDGDGKLDVVSNNYGTLYVLLGNGDGTFTNATVYNLSINPSSLALADMNGDGKLDVVTANSGTSNAAVLLGNGNGTFQTPTNYLAGSLPSGIAVADFNNDGRTDFAVSNSGNNNVTVYLGSLTQVLQLSSAHNGNFLFGQTGATYTLTVTNGGPGPTAGTLTVTDALPTGLTATGMSGTGWTCNLSTLTCTQAISLAVGTSAPPITLTVNVASNTPAQVTNLATASAPSAVTANASDITNITVIPAPVLLSPANGQPAVALVQTLVWTAAAGATSYDVYLGATPTPPLVGNSTSTTFSPSQLQPASVYYWRIVARNALGSASSPTWTFVTRYTSSLSFLSSPANTAAGLVIPPFSVVLFDGAGSVISSSNAQVTVTSSPAGINTTISAVNGVAVFTGLTLGTPGTYFLTASTNAFNPATSNTFTVSAATLASISGQVTSSGNAVAGVTVTANGSLNASTTTDATGNYTLTIPRTGSYTLSAARSGYSFTGPNAIANLSANQTMNFTGIAIPGLEFYPVSPCRVADTRPAAGFPATFGAPTMTAGQTRSFPIPSSSCGIPANAAAYSLNFTVVPTGAKPYLGVLTTYPTGQSRPNASTLNSYNGTVVANAAIVPAGTNGSIDVWVSDPTDVLFDINGYFAATSTTGLQFFPVSPCRVADTRPAAGFSATFGAPTMTAGQTRSFPVPSGTCAIPSSASAYSFNFTVVPPTPNGYLGLLTTWPVGPSRPNASTLNSYNGTVVANAAIVPAGPNGAINVYVSDKTDVLFDVNGYFAPKPATGLRFYPVSPCRIADTRLAAGFPYPFGAPTLSAGEMRTIPIPASSCGIPANAAAYSLNFTVVPPNQSYLGVLTTFPAGQTRPNASTLNSYTGTVVANAAIVPAGTGGAISLYVSDITDVLFDINGYFAP